MNDFSRMTDEDFDSMNEDEFDNLEKDAGSGGDPRDVVIDQGWLRIVNGSINLVGGDINLLGGTICGLRAEPRGEEPASPGLGQLYFDLGRRKLRCWDGDIWQDCW